MEVLSALLWFKLVANKDGSVASVERIEGAHDARGRSVHYLQAATKEDAIKIWASRYRARKQASAEYLANQRQTRLEKKLCIKCGKCPPAVNRQKCSNCTARQAALKLNRENGQGLRKKPVRVTDNETAAAAEEHSRKRPGSTHVMKARLFAECLEAFDSKPPASFRGWLVSRLLEQQEIINAKLASAGLRPSQESLAAQVLAKALAIPRKKSVARVDVTARKAG